MIIDLHVHTNALSPCSNLDPEEAVREAKRIGLDGICFTEHNKLWKPEDLERLSKKWDFPVFCGMEVETREGHILVFGLKNNQAGILAASDLRKTVDGAGGVMISAHPFRGFLLFGFADLQMTLQSACTRPVFQVVDALETYSGKSTKKENELALAVGQKIPLKGAGGSDAHSLEELGRCVTIFEHQITNQAELINELKNGSYRAGYFRR
ncbi:MAG: PHP domain-containing protein [Bacillota bacterium]